MAEAAPVRLVAPGCEFNEKEHSFRMDGRSIPGVTSMIQDMGYREPGANFYTDASRQRGSACHRACELVDIHCPQARSLDEVLERIQLGHPDPAMLARLHGYVAGYLLFKQEWGFCPRPDGNEVVAFSRVFRYAGIIDKLGELHRTPHARKALVDLKSWSPRPSKPKRTSALQVSLYRLLGQEFCDFNAEVGVVVDLPGDGSYRAWEVGTPQDMAMVLSFPKIWWDRANHGYARARGEEYE